MIKCYRCGQEIEEIQDNEDFLDDEMEYKRYICSHCGIVYEALLPEADEREGFHHYNENVKCNISNENHGYEGKCPICEHYVIAMNNFMRSEVWGDVDEEDVDEIGLLNDDTIVDVTYCPNCGADITVVPPKPSQEKDYPYFQENLNEDE